MSKASKKSNMSSNKQTARRGGGGGSGSGTKSKTTTPSKISVKFVICPTTGQKVFIQKITLKDLKQQQQQQQKQRQKTKQKPTTTTFNLLKSTSQRKQLYLISSLQTRQEQYHMAAKVLCEYEQSLLPAYGGRTWQISCSLSEPNSQVLFRSWKGTLELACLPHLLERIPTPPNWPGTQRRRKLNENEWEETSYDNPGTTTSNNGIGDDTSSSSSSRATTRTISTPLHKLQSREISTISTIAWDIKGSQYPIPTISMKWTSPNHKHFQSRKAAWEYATELCQYDVLLCKHLQGIGASGKRLHPFLPSLSTTIKVGQMRFERDGLWIIGQELQWQEERELEIQKEEEEEEKERQRQQQQEEEAKKKKKAAMTMKMSKKKGKGNEDNAATTDATTKLTSNEDTLEEQEQEHAKQQQRIRKASGLSLFLAETRVSYQKEQTDPITLREAETALRHIWKGKSHKDQVEWIDRARQINDEEEQKEVAANQGIITTTTNSTTTTTAASTTPFIAVVKKKKKKLTVRKPFRTTIPKFKPWTSPLSYYINCRREEYRIGRIADITADLNDKHHSHNTRRRKPRELFSYKEADSELRDIWNLKLPTLEKEQWKVHMEDDNQKGKEEEETAIAKEREAWAEEEEKARAAEEEAARVEEEEEAARAEEVARAEEAARAEAAAKMEPALATTLQPKDDVTPASINNYSNNDNTSSTTEAIKATSQEEQPVKGSPTQENVTPMSINASQQELQQLVEEKKEDEEDTASNASPQDCKPKAVEEQSASPKQMTENGVADTPKETDPKLLSTSTTADTQSPKAATVHVQEAEAEADPSGDTAKLPGSDKSAHSPSAKGTKVPTEATIVPRPDALPSNTTIVPAVIPKTAAAAVAAAAGRGQAMTKKKKRQYSNRRWCLDAGQISLCHDACMDHFDKVMLTVNSRDLHRELQDGFDLFRERGMGRYDMELPSFDNPELFGFLTDLQKAPWMPVVRAILGEDVLLIHKGCFLSMPGAAAQSYHQDGVHLATQTQRPCHAINVFVPLVDLTSRNGPTEFCLGSHILGHDDYDRDFVETPKVLAGTPVIFDYRLGHRGLGNSSRACRPIVYCTYARAAQGKEFRDSVNFSRRRYHKLGDLMEKPLTRDERSKRRRQSLEERKEQEQQPPRTSSSSSESVADAATASTVATAPVVESSASAAVSSPSAAAPNQLESNNSGIPARSPNGGAAKKGSKGGKNGENKTTKASPKKRAALSTPDKAAVPASCSQPATNGALLFDDVVAAVSTATVDPECPSSLSTNKRLRLQDSVIAMEVQEHQPLEGAIGMAPANGVVSTTDCHTLLLPTRP